MEAYVLRADGLQDLLMGVTEGIRVKHGVGLGRYEQVRTVGVLCVLLHQQLHRPLRDSQLTDGVGGLGLADHQLAVDAVHLLAETVIFSTSKSVHSRARSSPRRRPVVSSR